MNEDSTIDATRKTVRIYLAINEHGEIYVDKDCAKDAVDGLCSEWDCAAVRTIELAVTVDPPQIEVIPVTVMVPALTQAPMPVSLDTALGVCCKRSGGERIVSEERAHTPGPWSLWHNEKGAFVIGAAPEGTILCQRNDWDHRAAESTANARLIAAAPDLLDFARNVAGLDDRLLLNVDVLKQWRDDARAAIAKVEGTL